MTDDLESALSQAGAVREPMVDLGLKYVRRKVDQDWWYFISNHTAKPIDGWVPLGIKCTGATLFDPMSGAYGRLACRQQGNGSEVYLQLEPGVSVFVRAERAPSAISDWPYFRSAGDPIILAGTWSVEFIEGGPELPNPYRIEKLGSWTEAPDSKAQAFAGTARYTLEFSAPAVTAEEWLLDLGDVRESARVRLNGKEVGTLIALPFRIRVGEHLTKGVNRLEVEVTNLSANRIRDLELRKVNWKIMKDIKIVNVNYRPLDATRWLIEESGLLGPVRLVPLARFELQDSGSD